MGTHGGMGKHTISLPVNSVAEYSPLNGDKISTTNRIADKVLCPHGSPWFASHGSRLVRPAMRILFRRMANTGFAIGRVLFLRNAIANTTPTVRARMESSFVANSVESNTWEMRKGDPARSAFHVSRPLFRLFRDCTEHLLATI